jgi:prepilin-type N-terminal cleavage/methylation domain-containing protein
MRRREWQRGMTLIEVMVALAVTSIILVGLGSVLFDVSRTYQGWADRLDTASTGAGLASSIQADSHRYVVCGSFSQLDSQPTYMLDLCPADDLTQPAVRYQVSSSAPYVVTRRSPLSAAAVFMARSQTGIRPYFWADCLVAGGAISGHIHVEYLRLDDGSGVAGTNGTPYPWNFSVYYQAPERPGGCY